MFVAVRFKLQSKDYKYFVFIIFAPSTGSSLLWKKEGAGKRCSECGSDFPLALVVPFQTDTSFIVSSAWRKPKLLARSVRLAAWWWIGLLWSDIKGPLCWSSRFFFAGAVETGVGEGSGVGVEEAALKLGDISRSVGSFARAPTLFP